MKHIAIIGTVSVPQEDPYSHEHYNDMEPGFYIASPGSSYEGSLCCISLRENGERKIDMFYDEQEKVTVKDALRTTAPMQPSVTADRMVIDVNDIIRLTAAAADPAQARGLVK